jgi:hypothetical protein
VFVKDVTLSLALPQAVEKLRLRCSPERGAGWQPIEAPFEIYQDSSGGDNWKSTAHINRDRRVPLTFRGYRLTNGSAVTNGLRATPIVAAEGGAVGICLPYFWENFPKAIAVDEQSISVGLFPQQHADVFEIQGGEQKTHEMFVLFGNDPITDEPLEWCRTPVVASVDPTWTFSTGAVPFLTPLEDRHASLVGAAVDGPIVSSKSERSPTSMAGGTSGISTAITKRSVIADQACSCRITTISTTRSPASRTNSCAPAMRDGGA